MALRRTPALVWLGLGAVAAVWVASFAAPPMPPIHGDGLYTYYWARSLAFDGDLALANDYALCGDPWGKLEPVRPGLGPRNTWSPGPAVLWAPMLWAGRLLHPAARSADPTVAGACPNTPLAGLAMVGTLLAGLATVWLTYRLARRHLGPGPALFGAAGVGLASTLPYYATLLPSYGHAPAAFAVALAVERWDATRGDTRLRRWVLVGALCGLAMLMRPQCALVALGPLFEWLDEARTRRSPGRLAAWVGTGVAFAAAMVAVFSPQAVVWKLTYGGWFVVPQGAHYMRWHASALDGVLFASTGGLLVWTPLLYLAVAGLLVAALRRTTRRVALPLALFLIAFVYVNGAVWDWWGASSFGNRRFTSLAVAFGLGLAVVARDVLAWADRRPRAVAGAALAVGLVAFASWNYAAMWAEAKAKIPSHVEGRSDRFAVQVFEELTEDVWQTVGNPLSWPASLPFAIRYRTHPRRYDLLRGEGVFYRNFDTLALGQNEARIDLVGEPGAHYTARGFADAPLLVAGRRGRVTTRGEAAVLLPLFAGDVASVRLHWRNARADATSAPVAVVRWDGREVARVDVPKEWDATTVELPRGLAHPGINELVIASGARIAIERLSLQRVEPPRAE